MVPGYGSAIRGRLTRPVVFMTRRRFFVGAIERGHAQITGPDAHHLTRVLRVEPGQKFEISGYHRQENERGFEHRVAVLLGRAALRTQSASGIYLAHFATFRLDSLFSRLSGVSPLQTSSLIHIQMRCEGEIYIVSCMEDISPYFLCTPCFCSSYSKHHRQ